MQAGSEAKTSLVSNLTDVFCLLRQVHRYMRLFPVEHINDLSEIQ